MPTPSAIERYAGHDTPHPAIPAMGHARRIAAERGLALHHHDVFELCLIVEGSPRWQVEGDAYELRPGSAFLTRPGELHGHPRGVFEPCELRWIQIDPRHLPRDLSFAQRVADSETHAWASDAKLNDLHEMIIHECRRPRADSERVVGRVLPLLLEMLLRARDAESAGRTAPPPVARVLEAIEAHPHHRWTIDQLVDEARVSRARLQQLFKRHLGVSPIAYATRLRLREAQRRLTDTADPVTDIALDLGFSSSQHFATVFRQHYGITPTAYRREPRM